MFAKLSLGLFLTFAACAFGSEPRAFAKKKVDEWNCHALIAVHDHQSQETQFDFLGKETATHDNLHLYLHLRIGSVSKLFVGTVILRLVEDGVLSLDDPVSQYVPDIPSGETITLENLGYHTSGLPSAIRNEKFQKAILSEPDRVWKQDEILSFAFQQEPHFKPGEQWRYSNTNTILLAMCAERATSQTFNQLLKKYISDPLELENTMLSVTAELPKPHLPSFRYAKPNNAIGYGKIWTNVTHLNASWSHAAGNIISTIEDLSKAGPALASGSLLKPETHKLLFAWKETGEENYHYGFCIEKWDSFVGHRGDVPGYQSSVCYEPRTEKTLCIVVNLSNTADGRGPANELTKIIFSGGQ